MSRVLVLLVVCAGLCDALRIQPATRHSLVARRSFAAPMMQTEGGESGSDAPAPAPAPAPAYSTVYDDEVEPAPRKDPLSANMRARLLKEQQGMGADPGSKNPFLLVFGAVECWRHLVACLIFLASRATCSRCAVQVHS